MATTDPSRTVWRNATGKQLPPANNHGHAGVLTRPRDDDKCWTVPKGAGNMPMMQMGQQPTAAPMLMNNYAPNQQPNQMPGYF